MASDPLNSPPPNVHQTETPTRSMLAWWGAFPVIVFAATQTLLGWKNAQIHAGGPSFVLSYWMGGLVGGFVIASLVAWIAHRASGRSQLAGTVAFTVILALGTLSVARQAINDSSLNPAVNHASDKPVMASFGEFRFEIPAGWKSTAPDRDNQKACLLLNSDYWITADGRIDVIVGEPVLPTARQLAQSAAGKEGRVWPNPIQVDGIEGVRVDMATSDIEKPRFGVFVFREGKAYIIFAAQSPAHDVSSAFEHVLKTWHWNAAKK